LNLKDPKISQIVQIFERKVSSMEAKERELEQLVQSKEQALTQSERLRSHYRSQSHDGDMTKLRVMLAEFEAKTEEAQSQVAQASQDRDRHLNALATMQRDLDDRQTLLEHSRTEFNNLYSELQREKINLTKVLESQRSENEQEREMHQVLRKHYDDMKLKFEVASTSLFDKEEEVRVLNDIVVQKDVDNARERETVQKLETAIAKHEAELAKVREKESMQRQQIAKIEHELATTTKQSAMLKTELERVRIENQKLYKVKEQMKKIASEM